MPEDRRPPWPRLPSRRRRQGSGERCIHDHVAVEHEEVLVDDGLGLRDGVSGPQRLRLLDVVDRIASIRLADRVADRVAAVSDYDDELVDDTGHGVEHPFEQRPIADRKKWLRTTVR